MDPEIKDRQDHHDGASDAFPGGHDERRRPGELAFAAFLTVASLFLLYSAYGISGFEALSGAGSVPMATTLVIAVSALIVTVRTFRQPQTETKTLSRDILPGMVILFIAFPVLFGLLLRPLGFVPNAAVFLIIAIKVLARKGWGYTLAVALGSLVAIWIIFRVVFTVLLPAGILSEAEFIQFFRTLLSGGIA